MFTRILADGTPDPSLKPELGPDGWHYEIEGYDESKDSRLATLTFDPETNTVSATYREFTFEEIKGNKKAELYAKAASAINQITSLYSAGEISTFFLKERESSAYLQSTNPVDAPWLEQEANLRGVTIESIATTVLQKSAQLRAVTQRIIANRGLLCDAVDAANTIQAVEAVGMPLPPTPDPLPEPVPEPEPPIEPEP